MNPIVFETKKSRLLSFVGTFFMMILIMTPLWVPRCLLTDNINTRNVLLFLAASVVIALITAIIGLISGMRTSPKIKITVSDKEVQVIKGDAEGTYLIEDFIRGQKEIKSTGRSSKIYYTLLFEGGDDLLFIDLPGFSSTSFQQLSDTLCIRKQELTGEYPEDNKEMLTGGIYKGVYEYKSPVAIKGIIALFVAVLVLIWGTIAYFIMRESLSRSVIFMGFFTVLASVFLPVFIIMLYVSTKKLKESIIRNLSIGAFELKVNDDVINLADIERAYITPYYLKDIDGDYRVLAFKLNGSDAYKRYIVEKRPKSISFDDGYIKLYNSIMDLLKTQGVSAEIYDFSRGDFNFLKNNRRYSTTV